MGHINEGVKQMNNYELEELVPIVAKLTEKYTSKESTSVTYEKARQLMEAVIYCIHECEGGNQLATNEKLPVKDAYESGYKKLLLKVKQAQTAYSEMIVDFNSFGNKNYYDTVTKGISGFFQYYDDRFAPQETILTMDYPTIRPITQVSGIDAIEKYIEYISIEQKFMRALPEEYIIQILTRFQTNYRKQFYNICSIILRHILGNMLIKKSLGTVPSEKDYENMQNIILSESRENLEKILTVLLEKLIQEKFNADMSMLYYFKGDIENFVVELCAAGENKRLSRVVAL